MAKKTKNVNEAELGKRFMTLRKWNHKTQEKLAKEIGVSTDILSKIEHGERVYSTSFVKVLMHFSRHVCEPNILLAGQFPDNLKDFWEQNNAITMMNLAKATVEMAKSRLKENLRQYEEDLDDALDNAIAFLER